jgi:hypothetical protein
MSEYRSDAQVARSKVIAGSSFVRPEGVHR